MDFCSKTNKSLSNIQISLFVMLIFILSSVQNMEYIKRYYTKEFLILWNHSGIKPSNLNVHRKTNTLFFCFQRPLNFDSQIAFYKIDQKVSETIKEVNKGCANAIDQENDVIYLGSLKGIYKYNLETGKAEHFAEKNVHIASLFYNERLYYTRHPDGKLFMEHEGQFAHIAEFMDLQIDHFHVSNEGIVYFAVQNSVYIYDKNETRWDLKGLRKVHTVNAISEDNEGVVYLCTNRGVFTVVNNGLQKFMHERNIVGLASDRDNNLILADDISIFRLLRNDPVVVRNKNIIIDRE